MNSAPSAARAVSTWRRAPRWRRDRRLQGAFSEPITGRPNFVLSRAAALSASGLLATVAFQHPNAAVVAWTLIVAALVQPLLVFVPPRRAVSEYQALCDLVVIAVLLEAAPELWPMAMIWIGAGIALQALISPPWISGMMSAAAIGTITFAGIRNSQDRWYFGVSTAGFLAVAFTIYGRSLRREIWEHESVLLDALTAAGAVVHHSDLDRGQVVRVEGDLESLTGWTVDEWCGDHHQSFIHPDDLDTYWIAADDLLPGRVTDRVARKLRRDGSYMWMRDVALVTLDTRGRRMLRGFSLDVTDLEEARARSARQLREDVLTGLPNRLALNETLEHLLDSDAEFALMLSDLDRFKEVNDTLGHEAGDQLLQTVARRLADAVRPGDLVARLGGDEYAIVLVGDVSTERIKEIALRLSTECARPIVLNGVAVAVATSTGIALRSRSGSDRATMLRHADIAMYEAKRSSESYRVFDASLEQTSTLRLTLSGSLTGAIERGEITVYFQPKYDLECRRLVGAEGLARWQHPDFGLLTPPTFLDLALMSEAAVPFALSTIRQVAEMIRRVLDSGEAMPLAANVAMRALRDPELAPAVLAMLSDLGVPPDLLVLELTESDPLWPDTSTVLGLELLLDAGVQLSIDDFGTGHSSLERLRELRVHELKIDRSFVEGMMTDPLQRQLVHTIVDLAGRLDYRIVAEGVETEEQVDVLAGFGCPQAQGYLFARPMPPHEFFQLARDRTISAAS